MLRIKFNMAVFRDSFVLCLLFCVISPLYANFDENHVSAARIESCKGCRLNRLPDVKSFIYEDVPLYEDVTFKPIPGASPELVILNKFEKELERIDLAPLSRDACNALLVDRGFQKKVESDNKGHDDF